jgi:hypothetical protein
MWSHWRIAFLSGAAAGCASTLPMWSLEALYVVASAALIAVVVCLATWLGLWVSRRPDLPVLPALCVAGISAVTALLASLPSDTHAEIIASPAVMHDQRISMPSAYLVSLATLVLPAVAAFIAGRVFGVPPNTSLERTREG